MQRPKRYAIALATAGAVTTLAAALDGSAILLAGIYQVYAVGTVVALRTEGRQLATATGGTADTIFTGVTVFGVLTIAQGVSAEFHVVVAMFAFGLAYFGLVCGIWTVAEGVKVENGR